MKKGNKLKKMVEEFKRNDSRVIRELHEAAIGFMKEPGTWKYINRRTGELYEEAFRKSWMYIIEINEVILREDFEEEKEEIISPIVEKEEPILKGGKKEKIEIKLSETEERKIYFKLMDAKKEDGKHGNKKDIRKYRSVKGNLVKKYGRTTIDRIEKKGESRIYLRDLKGLRDEKANEKLEKSKDKSKLLKLRTVVIEDG